MNMGLILLCPLVGFDSSLQSLIQLHLNCFFQKINLEYLLTGVRAKYSSTRNKAFYPLGFSFQTLTPYLYWKLIGNLQAVVSSLSRPYGLTLFDRFVYWTDRKNLMLFRANKYNGTSVEVVATGLPKGLRDVRVFSPNRQLSRGACVNNGGCEELCLATSAIDRRSVQSLPVWRE